MRANLAGRKLVITGASRGIGERVARLASSRSARVALIGLEPERLAGIAEELGPGALWRAADVRSGSELRAAIDECAHEMGGIDSVVANAGVVAYGTLRQSEEAAFERVLDVNVNGVFRTLKYATPHLARSRGHALVVASAVSFAPTGGTFLLFSEQGRCGDAGLGVSARGGPPWHHRRLGASVVDRHRSHTPSGCRPGHNGAKS